MNFKAKRREHIPEDDITLLDRHGWSREIYTVAKDYFSPLTALTRNFVAHIKVDDTQQKLFEEQQKLFDPKQQKLFPDRQHKPFK